MYCPNCNQPVPDNTRFCSRCGLSLTELAEWLAGRGGLAIREAAQLNMPSARRKGMRTGAKIMFWGAVTFPVFLALSVAGDSPFPLVLPFIAFLAGLSILLYSRLFIEEISSSKVPQPQDLRFGTWPSNSALPPPSDFGVVTGSKREVRTAEMVQPPSVTDHTTKLLDRE